MKIKEIKTIVTEDPDRFDVAVNALLDKGYLLVGRRPEQVGPSAWKLYAELVKLDEADMEGQEADLPFGWDYAVEIIREECKGAAGCDERCPMNAWCQKNIPDGPPPSEWGDPE